MFPRLLAALFFVLCGCLQTFGQAAMRPCPPVADRTDAPGPACFTAKEELGKLTPGTYFWHLYTFPDRAQAEAAKLPHSTVVESLGKVWLFAVADAQWKPASGTYVAKLGPLTVKPGVDYEAVYMQSIFNPGMTAPLHTHSGMEAFYTLTGDTCLETSEGVQNARGPGNVVLAEGGLPMQLMATGTEKRRGVVLILHDSTQPATTLNPDWHPKGLCAPPAYEVSTIKPSESASNARSGISTDRGRLNAQNVTLLRCIIGAYEIGPHQVIGGPEWMNTERFDIIGKIPDNREEQADSDVLLQGTLAERFGLKLHRETKMLPAYVLEPVKEGAKIDKVDDGQASTMATSTNSMKSIEFTHTSMDDLARVLARNVDLPVVNGTSMQGVYNLKLRWTPENARFVNSTDVDYGSIFSAAQEQLGLRLRKTTAPIDVLVIDHVEQPSEN